jgi:hypothetical protein
MDPQHPRDVKLGEQHYNIERMVVIGPRLSDFIRNLDVPSLQLLSVKIRDHKGRIASSDFNIVHTTLVVDCLDTEASGAVWNPINEDHIVSWGTLTLRDDVAELPRIFRVSHLPGWIFVNEETAQAIEELGLKEPYLTELDSV